MINRSLKSGDEMLWYNNSLYKGEKETITEPHNNRVGFLPGYKMNNLSNSPIRDMENELKFL